eukprot:TRINITY_DN6767_c0_g1_i1.p1 TRINITY_DN6767_c0_g1~~TRINITY_DN6767_c0_g1_i1.p1  ORF type:complete len:294 (-),score=3.62 TRINITY_DN6767_c0_g1_i1:451-1332(-)
MISESDEKKIDLTSLVTFEVSSLTKKQLHLEYSKSEIVVAIITNLLKHNYATPVKTHFLEIILNFIKFADLSNEEHRITTEFILHASKQPFGNRLIYFVSLFIRTFQLGPLIEKKVLFNDAVLSKLEELTDYSREEILEVLRGMSANEFVGPTEVLGFVHTSGACVNVMSINRNLQVCLRQPETRAEIPLIEEVYRNVVLIHESIHYILRKLKGDFNYTTPTKGGIKESGTMLEIELFGEEVNFIRAANVLPLSWFHQFRVAVENNVNFPQLPQDVRSLFRARSTSMAFKSFE